MGSLNFSNKDRLLYHKLSIAKWLNEQQNQQNQTKATKKSNKTMPDKWKMIKDDIELYKWQQDCIDMWFENNMKGTVKVVTGAGKTLLAFAIIEKLQNTKEKNLNVAIVVPTIALMNQWYDEIIKNSNIPSHFIGKLGGGYRDKFSDGFKIIIAVSVSASNFLDGYVKEANIEDRFFLIVDECHRVGSKERIKILDIKRAYSLGLSATPERDENEQILNDNSAYNESKMGQSLGKIIYELSYKQALEFGIIPPFTIYHYALSLNPKEKDKYLELTRAIKEAKNNLEDLMPSSINNFWSWVQKEAENDTELGKLSKKLIVNTEQRKILLYQAESRINAVKKLIANELKKNKESQILLFHESIKEAENLYSQLPKEFSAVLEHSNLPGSLRETSLELFRQKIAKTLVSVKSLVEGFNVPSVDVGIIVASSSSIRQRIQSIGRIMRKYKTGNEEKKFSKIIVLYIKDTIDDAIYRKFDWNSFLGIESNRYFIWPDINKEPIEQFNPPHIPKPKDFQIDVSKLKQGDIYPGEYEGDEYTIDSFKNIRDMNNNLIQSVENLSAAILKIKGPGRFRVTKNKHNVLVLNQNNGMWETIFVMQLKEPLKPYTNESEIDIKNWIKNAKAGDIFPNQDLSIQETFIFKTKKGGIIAKKVKNGELFARTDKAIDKEKGEDAKKTINNILHLKSRGIDIKKFMLTKENVLVYAKDSNYYFICKIDKGFEFKES